MPKISALPAATLPLAGTELFVCVQGGVTVQSAIADIGGGAGTGPTWTTPAAGSLRWQNVATTSYFTLTDGGSLDWTMEQSLSWGFAPGGTLAWSLATAGSTVTISVNTGGVFIIGSTSGGQINITNVGSVLTINGWTAITVQYVAGAPGNWAGSAPTDLGTAIDRIANVVSAGGGSPIP